MFSNVPSALQGKWDEGGEAASMSDDGNNGGGGNDVIKQAEDFEMPLI